MASNLEQLKTAAGVTPVVAVADDGTVERGTPRTMWLGLRVNPR